jgi:hypothetical protein
MGNNTVAPNTVDQEDASLIAIGRGLALLSERAIVAAYEADPENVGTLLSEALDAVDRAQRAGAK